MTGALTGLNILECKIVNRLALRIRMPDIFQHLHTCWPYIDFLRDASERGHQTPRLLERSLAGRKPGHRDRHDIAPRLAETVHRARAYQQRMRRIDAARNANDDALDPGRAQPRNQTLNLDIENFGASLVARRRIGRHVGEALVAPLREHLPAPRQLHRKCNPPKSPDPLGFAPRGIAKRVLPHPLLREPLEIDFRAD